MRRIVFFISLLFPSVLLGAVTSINSFGGLNTKDSPMTLIGQSPDSENVVTDDGNGLTGRKGFVTSSTEPSSALWTFPMSNGTRYLITRSSNTLKATTGTSFTVTVSTVANGVETVGTPLGDKWYFANTTDGLKYWDGSSVVLASAAMKVDKLVTFKGRLAAAGKSGSLRVIYLSKYLDGTSFTPPVDAAETDAAQLTISGNLDDKIAALYATYQDKLVWFTQASFGSVYGTRRSNFTMRTHSDTVGISDAHSIQDCDGRLRWLGQGRKIYEFDGSTFRVISEEIDSVMSTIAQGDYATRVFTQTSQSDFSAGTSTPSVYVDTQSAPGYIYLSFPEGFSSFNNGSNGKKALWTPYDSGSLDGTQSVNTEEKAIGGDSSQLFFRHGGNSSGYVNIRITEKIPDFKQGTTYHYRLSQMPVDATEGEAFSFVLTPSLVASPTNPVDSSYLFKASVYSTSTGIGYFNYIDIDGISGGSSTSSFSIPADIDIYLSTTTYAISANNSVLTSGTHTGTTGTQYLYMGYTKGTLGTGQVYIGNFWIVPQTATYYSQIGNTLSMNSWGYFIATKLDSTNGYGGSHSFYVRSATESFTVLSTTPTWTAVTSGAIPSISTGSYFQIRDDMTLTSATGVSSLVALADVTQNYFQGSSIKTASVYTGQRYWLSVSISSTGNNTVLVYDKRGQWQKYTGIHAASLISHYSKPYFGNSNGIYEAETGYSDNGSEITSYYKTGDIILNGLDRWTKLSKIYATMENSGATLSTDYYVNGIDTVYSLGDYLMSTTSGHQNAKLPFSMTEVQMAKTLGIKFTVTGSSFWRLINANIYHIPDTEED